MKNERICSKCGADIDAWRDVFGEIHICQVVLNRTLFDRLSQTDKFKINPTSWIIKLQEARN